MSAPEDGPEYNPIYEQLTDQFEDQKELLSGFIAYGFYKEAKREWVTNFFSRRSRKPNQEELDAYISTWTETRLQGLRDQAAGVIASYADNVIEEASPDIREDAIAGRISTDLADFKRAGSFTLRKLLGSIGLSMLGAMFWTLFLFIIAIVLRFGGIDVLDVNGKVMEAAGERDDAQSTLPAGGVTRP